MRPLDAARLEALAMRYVGRYATTESRLARYLRRKVGERGWGSETPVPVDDIVAKMVRLGFVDDFSFAAQRTTALTRRGYGGRRIAQSLNAAGIDREMAATLAPDAESALAAADSYARRRRFGPYAAGPVDPDTRRKHFAAMVRAGHDYDLARHFTDGSNNADERQET